MVENSAQSPSPPGSTMRQFLFSVRFCLSVTRAAGTLRALTSDAVVVSTKAKEGPKLSTSKHRFLVLDAMRGIAAAVVLVEHLGGRPGTFVSGGYLAVDLFFVLSGFVLAHAYGSNSVSFAEFMRIRLVRLYPLYAVGLFFGFIVYMLYERLNWRILMSLVLNLFFLPTPYSIPAHASLAYAAFPFDSPAWSLFFELAVNAAWFSFKRPLIKTKLYLLCGLGAVSLIIWGLHHGSINGGSDIPTFFGGVPRVTYSFFAGVAVYHIWCATSFRIRVPLWLIVAILSFIFMAPFPRIIFDLLATIVLFPAIVLLGAMQKPPKLLASGCAAMGSLSYGLYVLHAPILSFASFYVSEQHTFVIKHIYSFTALFTLAITGTAVWFLDRYYDYPVRRWLMPR